jgi:hypothetical protein
MRRCFQASIWTISGVTFTTKHASSIIPLDPAIFPASGLGRTQHRFTNFLCLPRISKGGDTGSPRFERLQKIGYIMYKSMFITDANARYPSLIDVWQISIRHMDRSPRTIDSSLWSKSCSIPAVGHANGHFHYR